MTYRAAEHRADDRSPAGGARGPSLTVDTNVNGRLNGEASAFRPNKFLLHDSTPDPIIVSSEATGVNGSSIKKIIPTPIGPTNGVSPTRVSVSYTTDHVTAPSKFLGGHYVEVVADNDKYNRLFEELSTAFNFQAWVRGSFVKVQREGKRITLCLCFDDVRRAKGAQEAVEVVDTTADFNYVSQPEYASAQKDAQAKKSSDAGGPPSSFFDGQAMFYAEFNGHITASKADGLEGQVRGLASKYGDILALGELDAKNGVARFRVEYYSIKAAKDAVKNVTIDSPTDLAGWIVHAQELPDLASASSSETGTGVAGRGTPFGSANGDVANSWCSPTGRTGWVTDMQTGEKVPAGKMVGNRHSPVNGGEIALWSANRSSPTTIGLGALSNGGQRQGPLSMPPFAPGLWGTNNTPNQVVPFNESYGRGRNDHADNLQAVNPDLIRQGLDVRTTLMLRNLPNQMTCHVLKKLLDDSNFGGYDFSYVRIDYEKGASVGYGFVNFTSPEEIIKFLEGHIGRPWMPGLPSRRGAARLAEVSYATVQGYDCCIEKFRNSSVMTEFVDYRPKLWYTKATAPSKDLVGEEVDFPGVNNPSKHQRSLANATQIGLFPPQSRRAPGGTHRPARSQFDRGTTAQQQEDMLYHMHNHMQRMSLNQAAPFGAGQMPYPIPPMSSMPPTSMVPVTPHYQAPLAPGHSVFANYGAMMASPGYYMQPPVHMPSVAPQYMNGYGFAADPNAAAQLSGNGHQNGQHPTAVPRTFIETNNVEGTFNSAGGNVNASAVKGSHSSHAQKTQESGEEK